MSQEERLINGELFRLRREAQGWVLNDMALRACLSVKQIKQLEEGGTSAFYSEAVKLTAAKKVGGLLGLSIDEIFVSTADAEQDSQPLVDETSSEKPHIQPTIENEPLAQFSPASESTVEVTQSVQSERSSKTPLGLIAGLFVAALAAAAYMQPKDEVPSEAPPPLQVVPSEVDTAASAPEAAVPSSAAASSAALNVAPAVQKQASTAASAPSSAPASAVVPTGSSVKAP